MADYIDREKLIRDLIDKGFYPALVKRAIENTPTEDVVPRSEVVEEVLAKVKELVKEYMLDKGLYLATLKHALNYAEKIIKGAE